MLQLALCSETAPTPHSILMMVLGLVRTDPEPVATPSSKEFYVTQYRPQPDPPSRPRQSGPSWQLVLAANAGFLAWLFTHDLSIALTVTSVCLSAFPPPSDKNDPESF